MASDGYPSEEQRAVVDTVRGAGLVLAPAGTGKTRVMASRLAAALRAGVDPDRTLCLTFTSRAARQVRERLAAELGTAPDVHVRTFHGLCAWILRQETDALGLAVDFCIYDEQDVAGVLRELGAEEGGAKDLVYRLLRAKADAAAERLGLDGASVVDERWGVKEFGPLFRRYHEAMAERQALDFADLACRVRALLRLDPAAGERWGRRFEWVQVDDVQDTQHNEYEVVAALARRTGDLFLFGDPDQTAYGWRGSDPDAVLARFRDEFAPVREFGLAWSHRATRRLVRAADRVAAGIPRRATRIRPAPGLPEGDPVILHGARDPEAEALWVARQVKDARGRGGSVGVLARSHRRLAVLSEAMGREGVPHVTVEQFEFFRRQEIKDALARLKVVLHPADSGALRRCLLRPAAGVGAAALRDIDRAGASAGLRLCDLVRPHTLRLGDPFAPLLTALAEGRVVVLDTEATGLRPGRDEVVEIAAARVGPDGPVAEFHRYLRPRRGVGASVAVHGLEDDFLAENGVAPARALSDLAAFLEGAHVVGHNVAFDLDLLRAQAEALHATWPDAPWDDTFDLGRRLVRCERYTLACLSRHLGLAQRPRYRAADDVAATADLLRALAPRIAEGAEARRRIVGRHAPAFRPQAERFARWRALASRLRPAPLLARILDESGLLDHYGTAPRRLGHLKDLEAFFEHHDDGRLAPTAALLDVVQQATLARNVDHLAPDDPRTPLITLHAAKGVEFDAVFLAGATDGELPNHFAKQDGRLDEERRLFYVAVTRSRRTLAISWSRFDDRHHERAPSPFLRPLGGL